MLDHYHCRYYTAFDMHSCTCLDGLEYSCSDTCCPILCSMKHRASALFSRPASQKDAVRLLVTTACITNITLASFVSLCSFVCRVVTCNAQSCGDASTAIDYTCAFVTYHQHSASRLKVRLLYDALYSAKSWDARVLGPQISPHLKLNTHPVLQMR